jgi:hypothetical protein
MSRVRIRLVGGPGNSDNVAKPWSGGSPRRCPAPGISFGPEKRGKIVT